MVCQSNLGTTIPYNISNDNERTEMANSHLMARKPQQLHTRVRRTFTLFTIIISVFAYACVLFVDAYTTLLIYETAVEEIKKHHSDGRDGDITAASRNRERLFNRMRTVEGSSPYFI